MRALLILSNFLVLGLVYSLASTTGLLMAMAGCFGLAALLFATSTGDSRGRSSNPLQSRSGGGHSTFIAPLTQF